MSNNLVAMITYSIISKSQLEGAKRLDAEYYQPEYLGLRDNLNRAGSVKLWRDIEGKFITGPFGSEFNTENYVTDGKYRYVRGKDVKNFFLTDEDNVYIPDDDYARLKKYSLSAGDILISVVGTPGIASIVDKTIPPAIFSCKSTAYRTKAISPFYFIAYLNSTYGRKLLQRSVRGAVQTGLNIDDLKDLPVYVPADSDQRAIANIVEQAKASYDESKSFYSQAENLLLEELGLKDFKAEDDLSYIVNLSEVKFAHRADAEYFPPKYELVDRHIKDKKHSTLGEMSVFVGHATQAPYDERGSIAVLAQKHMKRNLQIEVDGFDNFTTDDLIKKNDKKYVLKKGDILISSAGEPGLTSVWTGDRGAKVIPGSFVTVARLKDDIEPLYIGVFLNTPAGKLQFERNYTGSVQQYVYPAKIKEILVPILPKKIQQKIAELVRQSHEARKRAQRLLDEAKQKVEEMIEK